MDPRRGRSHLDQLDSVICCAECSPPVVVEVPVGVFYRLREHDLVRCPNGHQGTLLEYRHAANHPGERCGPFLLQALTALAGETSPMPA
ncbi:MAG TPA: hypothetical protein VFM15_09040 [Gammaproteobacteria bacterium]|nr:hypothetical protein [Gammaproteobacteria bacterium]